MWPLSTSFLTGGFIAAWLMQMVPAKTPEVLRDTGGSGRRTPRPNVLMIIIDDLRPEMGAYYDIRRPNSVFSRIRTPSMNALASRSLLLKNAYVQQAICAPSRVSLLTSRRPDTTHIYTIEDTYWRHVAGDFITIPQFFKHHGYRSIGIGKIFHHGSGSNHDDPPSWSDDYYSVPKESKLHYYERSKSWRPVTPGERMKQPLPDDYVADKAVELLKQVADKARRGQYLDLYPPEDVPLPSRSTVPTKMPDIAWKNWEIRKYPDIAGLNIRDEIDESLPVNVTRDLRRAYYCAVSYIDDLVGRVLWQLEAQGLANNTVVALFGDHGWHLGEGNLWGKHTNFELSTRAPLMFRVPGLTDAGLIHDRPVEFVDIFPTLVDATGLPSIPICPENSANVALCTEGSSLVDLMTGDDSADKLVRGHPSQSTRPRRQRRKEFAFSQYPRRGFSVMGYSIRTDRYRYTEWIRRSKQRSEDSVRGSRLRIVHAVELYDHLVDPDETVNVADDPAYGRDQVQLSRALTAGWRWALTSNNISEAVNVRQRVRRVTVRPPRHLSRG